MALRLGMVTIDTDKALPLARWWAEQLGGSIVEENDGWYVMVKFSDDAPLLSFQQVDDPTPGKNRLHLDFTVPDIDAETARLIAAGATQVADHTMQEGFRWIVLADPDGNQFCVAPHDAEGGPETFA